MKFSIKDFLSKSGFPQVIIYPDFNIDTLMIVHIGMIVELGKPIRVNSTGCYPKRNICQYIFFQYEYSVADYVCSFQRIYITSKQHGWLNYKIKKESYTAQKMKFSI